MDIPLEPALQVDEFIRPRRSLRIAFVTETYPPEVNGVATTTAKFVEGLHELHHDVQLIRPRQDSSDSASSALRFHEVLMRGLPIPKYPHLRMGVPSKRALVKLWTRRRPDVVHVATEGPLGWSAVQAAVQLDLPLTSDFRTNFHAYCQHYGVGWLKRPVMGYLRKLHNRCAFTMVPTEPLRRDLEAAGFKRLRVVQRGVDTVQFSPVWRSPALRESWGVTPDDLVVGLVGRLAPEKNLQLLLVAFDRIRQQLPRARLVMVGDGPLAAQLAATRPDVVLSGVRKGADLAAHYASMDLFLFPSMTETFGNVTAEALASGLPVVAFDHAAAGQLIRPGHDGLLAPLGDSDAFIAAASILASDRELRHAIGRHARSTALEIGWQGVVARFASHLAAACGVSSVDGAEMASPPPAAVSQVPA